MENSDVIVSDYYDYKNDAISFPCSVQDVEHNNVFWHGDMDAVNDGYSPSNDALYGGIILKEMYQKWYNTPILTDKSTEWNTKKAFDVMVSANMNYWTSSSTFEQGACGVIQATRDHDYDVDTVLAALKAVKIDVQECPAI